MSDELSTIQEAHEHEWDDLKDMNTLLCSACGATIPCGKKKAKVLPVVQKAQPVEGAPSFKSPFYPDSNMSCYRDSDLERERLGYEKKIEGYEEREQLILHELLELDVLLFSANEQLEVEKNLELGLEINGKARVKLHKIIELLGLSKQ